MSTTAYREKVDEASGVLEWLRAHLDDYERDALALELLEATRHGKDYDTVLGPWALTVVMRAHPDFGPQAKEWWNLESSGELFRDTPLAGSGGFAFQ